MAAIIIWGLLVLAVILSLFRPWLGIVGYYGFLFLQPKWNWAYAFPTEVTFERYIIIAVLVGGLLQCRNAPHVHPLVKFSLVGLTVWVSVAFMGTYWAIDPRFSNFVFGSIWKIALVAGLSCVAFIEPSRIITLLRGSTIASLYSSYSITKDYLDIGFCRYIADGWGRNIGSNQASMIFTGLAMISLCLTLYEKKVAWRILAFCAFVLQMHAVMLLESRSCMIGAVVAIGIVCYFVPKTKQTVSILTMGFLAGAVLAGPSVINEFGSVFTDSDELDISAKSRFDTWKAGLSACEASPWFGLGPNMSGYQVVKFLPDIYLDGGERTMKNPHNSPIEVLADYGLVGFLGYYSFILLNMVCAFIYLRRKDTSTEEQLALLSAFSGIIAISLASIFSSCLLVEIYYMCAAIAAGAANYRYGINRYQDLQEYEEDFQDDAQDVEFQHWESDLVPVTN